MKPENSLANKFLHIFWNFTLIQQVKLNSIYITNTIYLISSHYIYFILELFWLKKFPSRYNIFFKEICCRLLYIMKCRFCFSSPFFPKRDRTSSMWMIEVAIYTDDENRSKMRCCLHFFHFLFFWWTQVLYVVHVHAYKIILQLK